MTERKETFGEWVRRKREATPHTVRQVAEAIGVSYQQLNNVENGYRKGEKGRPARLAPDKVIRLAEFYGASPSELLDLAGYYVHYPELSKAGLRVGEIVDRLPAHEQENVLSFAEMRLRNEMIKRQGGGGRVRDSGIVTTDPRTRGQSAAKKDLRRRA